MAKLLLPTLSSLALLPTASVAAKRRFHMEAMVYLFTMFFVAVSLGACGGVRRWRKCQREGAWDRTGPGRAQAHPRLKCRYLGLPGMPTFGLLAPASQQHHSQADPGRPQQEPFRLWSLPEPEPAPPGLPPSRHPGSGGSSP